MPPSPRSPWTTAIKKCADPKRAKHFLETLAATPANDFLKKASADHARILTALLSGSQALSNWLVAHPDRISVLEPGYLRFPRRRQGFRKETDEWLKPLLEQRDYTGALSRIREFKQKETFRVAARDLARLSNTTEITQELSDLADVCLDTVWLVCQRRLEERHGQPFHQDPDGNWNPTSACVIGLGKLGGQELNYSSDVDVFFIYSEEGSTFRESPVAPANRRAAPSPVLQNHQFFNRLAESFIAELTRVASEGPLYRIDLRLRPEGDLGPLTRSLPSYETYYAQSGQTWERMMLIKARGVAGSQSLPAEFLELIQPFRYPRSLTQGVLTEVAEMKDRIENEVVKAGELDRNVKLGRGGIREIEFIAQALQLLHAGRQPFLQGSQTLPCLQKLVQYELVSPEDSVLLTEAYGFLRDVEHRLQMDENRQTHTIPTNRDACLRLARLMGFSSLTKFEGVRDQRTENVRCIFDRLLKSDDKSQRHELPSQFHGSEAAWKKILTEHNFKDVEKAFRVLREFVEGPGFVHVSPRTIRLALALLPKLFSLCRKALPTETASAQGPQFSIFNSQSSILNHRGSTFSSASSGNPQPPLSDPDRVLTRLDSFVAAYGARATLFELWNSNPAIFELLVLLFDRSEFLAEMAIRTPDLVDELVTSGRMRRKKSAEETLNDLRHGHKDADQSLWMRQYHQAEIMRIGLRDILGLADFEQYLTELSGLADASLQYALEVVMRKHRLKSPPFVIIGLGKLGGNEIDYGSDLDLLFVAPPEAREVPKRARFALEVMELLSARTAHGMLFHTDARLRPDGEKGLLVNTLDHYETYYRNRAHLWEIQTLTRTRAVAGDAKTGAHFQKLAATLTNFRTPSRPLAAFSSDWKEKIRQMRSRIETERTPKGKDALSIKTGSGGLMDAEFIAQTLCMENGWQEANTLKALERARNAGVLPDADKLIDNYRRLRRVEGILRRWSYEGETVLPDDPAPYYRVSVRCGFETLEAFRDALASCRNSIRQVYLKLFPR
jgi:glutamate-ammonia-ligase adenylyltransferase